MIIKREPSFDVRICIAGNKDDAARICRQFCFDQGLCVTLEPADYIYTADQMRAYGRACIAAQAALKEGKS